MKTIHAIAISLALLCAVSACDSVTSSTAKTAPIADPSRFAQCAKDTDCKGDRVCDNGKCGNPVIHGVLESAVGAAAAPVENAPKEAETPAAKPNTPKFSDYPADIYTGPAAELDTSSEAAQDFRTRFSAELYRDPSFAGEYIGVQWGCGTECVSQNFVSKRTGKVLEQSFGGEGGERVEAMHANSRLIVTKGPVLDGDYNEIDYKVKFYVLKGAKFELLHEASIPRPVEE